eukprot:6922198-Pyramimonas_sp.AAC.1
MANNVPHVLQHCSRGPARRLDENTPRAPSAGASRLELPGRPQPPGHLQEMPKTAPRGPLRAL